MLRAVLRREEFRNLGVAEIGVYGKFEAVLHGTKYVLPRDVIDGRL